MGYPKHLKLSTLYTTQGSLEGFRMVFDILRWLIDRYEPGAVIFGGTENEVDRIVLTRSSVEFLVVKAGIKLNPLKLYSGSISAAEELLKVVHLIMKVPSNSAEKHSEKFVREIDIEDKVSHEYIPLTFIHCVYSITKLCVNFRFKIGNAAENCRQN